MPAEMPAFDERSWRFEAWECMQGTASGASRWKRSQHSFQDLLLIARGDQPRCLMLFINTPEPEPPNLDRTHALLRRELDLSSAFFSNLCTKLNGYFRAHISPARDNRPELVKTEVRFLCKKHEPDAAQTHKIQYSWSQLVFATRWSPNGNTLLYCLELSPANRLLMREAVEALSFDAATSSPHALHTAILSIVSQVFNDSLWEWRDVVRDIEKQRGDKQTPKADYIHMHEVARHTAHSSESLATSLNVLAELMEANERYHKLAEKRDDVHADLAYHRSVLRCLLERSKALELRLANEINLAFHMNAQKDSLSAAQIATAAQRDSTTMKTVSILGLVFLPGTLISAIFSTSFFDYSGASEDGAWSVSGQFWIFWAFTIPITLITLASWSLWQWQQRARK